MGRYKGRRILSVSRYQGRRVLPPPPWRWSLIFLLTVILLASGGLLGRDLYHAHREQAAYRELSRRAHEAEIWFLSPHTEAAAPEEPLPNISTGETALELSPYKALVQENPDLTGWLTIEGTAVDYPVMYTPQEPEYYLRRAFDKSNAVSGSLFVGSGCEPDGVHVIIYGHNMRDGSMFGSLSGYAEENYAADHPVIRFNTLTQTGEYQVLAAFYSYAYTPGEEGFRYYRYTDLSRREDFEDYVRQVREAALYETETEAEYGDRLLTLSTCSSHRKNGTFVVVAVAPAIPQSKQNLDT